MSDIPESELTVWKQMVHGNALDEWANTVQPVIVLGPQGSGKSTFISIQLGAQYERCRIEVESEIDGEKFKEVMRVLKLVQTDKRIPQTSSGFTSWTLNPALYKDTYDYIDTAGLNEDRTEMHRTWVTWNVSMLFSTLPMIKCVVMVIDFRTLAAGRAHAIRDLARSLTNVLGTGDCNRPFYESMIFVVTHGTRDGEPVDAKGVRLLAKQAGKEKQERFKEKYGGTNAGQRQLDAAALKEQADDVAIITLLKTLGDAEGRVYMASPDTPHDCSNQRLALHGMIKKAKPVTKEQLQAMATSRASNSLQVVQALAKIASEPSAALGDRSYVATERLLADCLKELCDHLQQRKRDMEATQNDWRSVQRMEVDRLTRQRDELASFIRENRETIQSKKVSESLVIIAQLEVKRSCPTSGWWALCMFGGGWGWGKTSAEDTVKYDAHPFTEYSIRGGNYDESVLCDNREQGKLEIKFTSEPAGCDLDLVIDIKCPEKDTAEAKRFVRSLQEQNAELEKQRQDVHENLLQCNAVQGENEMASFLLKEKERLETAYNEFVAQLQQPAVQSTMDFPRRLSELDVLSPLGKLIGVLLKYKLLPTDLHDATRDSITAFHKEFERVAEQQQRLATSTGGKYVSLKSDDIAVQRPDTDPLRPSLSARFESLADHAIKKARNVRTITKLDHLALAVATFAFGIQVRGLEQFLDFLGAVVISFAVYLLVSWFRSAGAHNLSLQKDGVYRSAERASRTALQTIREEASKTRRTMENAAEKVTLAKADVQVCRIM